MKDGKQYYWCMQHQGEKGLYVTHHPHDHGVHPSKWKHTKRITNNGTNNGNNIPGTAPPDSKLQLNDKMKSALTSSGLSPEQASEMIESLQNNSGMDFW